jgi:hypothetical protein
MVAAASLIKMKAKATTTTTTVTKTTTAKTVITIINSSQKPDYHEARGL